MLRDLVYAMQSESRWSIGWLLNEDVSVPMMLEKEPVGCENRFNILVASKSETFHKDVAQIYRYRDVDLVVPMFGCVEGN